MGGALVNEARSEYEPRIWLVGVYVNALLRGSYSAGPTAENTRLVGGSYTRLVYGVAGASDVGVWDEAFCGELLGVVGCTGQTVYVYACDEVLRDLRTLRGSYTSLVYEPRIRGGRGVG